MRGGGEPGQVANESGLRSLGARVDASHQRSTKSKVRRSGKPKWSATKKTVVALLSLLLLVVAAVGGGYGYLWYRYDQISKVHIADEVTAANGAPFTLLVIGSDSRVGDTGQAAQNFGSASVVTGQRSDVVQLWRVTPATKSIEVLSIPRDTVVTMLPPDSDQFGQYNRINSSYNSGADQLVKTITANFGIPINHVVQVDFSGFQDAVNALGGIYLDFPYPAKDSYSGLDITTPGCQLLNGFQALAVARARHYEYYANGYWQYDPTSDFGRIERQDVFLRALITAAKGKVNPLTVNAFIGSIHEGITIDDGWSFNELIGLALDYHSFNPNALAAQTLPTVEANGFGDLGDVLAIDQPAAQQMLVNIFGSSLVTPTNPPPNENGVVVPPPTVTPTTAAPAPTGTPATGSTTTPTTAPPSYNPTTCTPS
jgi:LCP family protein required for cell wall assembly